MKRPVSMIALLVLLGCASGGYADRRMTAEVVEEAVVENNSRVNAITGSGTLSVETPEIAQNVSFDLTLRKPDSIMVKIEGPFGIDLGLALITREEFLFYNSMNNEVLTGPTNAQNLGRFLRVALDFDDLLNLFSGGVFLREDRGREGVLTIEDETYVLTFPHENGIRKYLIEPRSLQIIRIEHLDLRGNILLEQAFANFVDLEGVTVPQLVRVTARRERRRISLAYSSLSINPSSLDFRVEIPADAERARMK